MNFEVLKRSHVKRNILIAVAIVFILSAIILTFTKAKYKITESMPLVNGTINYELSDFNLIGAYIQEGEEYKQTNEIPTSGYEFNVEKSYCTVNNENINTTLNYDMETQNLTITPLTTKGTKCYLYFDEKASGGDYILAGDNPPKNSTTDWTGGTSYYYTGNPNNWVEFAGFWWRIIRINGDGSIRMIYQGTSANTTGSGTQIGESFFNISCNNNMYVGYMYGSSSSDYNTTHSNTNSSTIKGVLDQWYSVTSGLTTYAEYIDGNAGFCGDRTTYSGSGTGTTQTYYAAYNRLVNVNNPSLQCESRDVYTTTDSSTGNKSLTYPIGLLTADEAALAGITCNNANTESYLYTNSSYWTMSPSSYGYGVAHVFVLDSNTISSGWGVIDSPDIRPVINLRSDIQITGTGTTSDPFKVVGA